MLSMPAVVDRVATNLAPVAADHLLLAAAAAATRVVAVPAVPKEGSAVHSGSDTARRLPVVAAATSLPTHLDHPANREHQQVRLVFQLHQVRH